MHISIKFCLDFFITSRSIHLVLIGFQYIFVSFCILVYFVAFCILVYFVSLRLVSHFSIFCFVAFRFAFQYISFRCVSFLILVYFVAFRNISFRFVSLRFDFVSQFSTTHITHKLLRLIGTIGFLNSQKSIKYRHCLTKSILFCLY